MLHPKFVITAGGMLRLGMVNMHKDLLQHGDVCLGGGFWEIDYVANRLLLDGRSFDYGEPRWSRVKELVVPKSYEGMRIYYRGGAMADDFDVSGQLKVTYL